MPRKSRMVIPGLTHHITQRGNRRQNVFFNNEDRLFYLDNLKKFTKKYNIDLLSYCLMTNHVHLALVPHTEDSLNKLFRACHARYALRINKRNGWNGHLWQERFFSSVVEEESLFSVVSYIELNPVRAGMCKSAGDYRWSSANARLNNKIDPLLSYNSPLHKIIPAGILWSEILAEFDELNIDKLRERFAKNLPCGTPSFINRLELQFKRKLKIAKLGRPFNKPNSENNSDCPH